MRKLSRYNEFIQNENLAYRQEKVRRNYNDFTHILLESRRTEEEALNILKKKIVDEVERQNILNEFKKLDKSEEQKNLTLFAHLYVMGGTNVPSAEQISGIIDSYEKLRDKNRIKPLQIIKGGLMVGNETFTDFIKFSEYIHSIENLQYVGSSVASDFKPKSKSIWSGNGIEVYDGTSVGSCIEYSRGALTGKSYSFCIGKPGGQNMYQSYRDRDVSTFYFIVDRNKFKINTDGTNNLDDPLHIIVFDNTKKGILLTDQNNRTGTIAEPYGNDVNKYLEYLKSKGVPVEKLIHKPKTQEEEKEQKLLGKRNKDLDWFKNLNYDQKFNYLGRGHQLTDEQFDYVADSKGEGPERLLEKYVSLGTQITQYQFGKLNKNLKNSYFHSRMLGVEQGVSLEDWEVGYLISNNKNDDLKKSIEKGNRISDDNFSKLGDEFKRLYIEKGNRISDDNFSKLGDEFKRLYINVFSAREYVEIDDITPLVLDYLINNGLLEKCLEKMNAHKFKLLLNELDKLENKNLEKFLSQLKTSKSFNNNFSEIAAEKYGAINMITSKFGFEISRRFLGEEKFNEYIKFLEKPEVDSRNNLESILFPSYTIAYPGTIKYILENPKMVNNLDFYDIYGLFYWSKIEDKDYLVRKLGKKFDEFLSVSERNDYIGHDKNYLYRRLEYVFGFITSILDYPEILDKVMKNPTMKRYIEDYIKNYPDNISQELREIYKQDGNKYSKLQEILNSYFKTKVSKSY